MWIMQWIIDLFWREGNIFILHVHIYIYIYNFLSVAEGEGCNQGCQGNWTLQQGHCKLWSWCLNKETVMFTTFYFPDCSSWLLIYKTSNSIFLINQKPEYFGKVSIYCLICKVVLCVIRREIIVNHVYWLNWKCFNHTNNFCKWWNP